jgi:hypothetical protein
MRWDGGFAGGGEAGSVAAVAAFLFRALGLDPPLAGGGR